MKLNVTRFISIRWERGWKQLVLRIFGFELFELLWAGEPHGQRHLRVSFLTMVMLHLFLNYPNYLGRYRKGWEFSTSTLRRGWWLRWVCNWSLGYGGDAYGATNGPQPHPVHRLGKFGFVNHNAKAKLADFNHEADELYDEYSYDYPDTNDND